MSINYKNLEQNIKSTVYEGLLKLGYSNGETFSIYYDLDLLNHLLEFNFPSNDECNLVLQDLCNHMTIFENISVTLQKNRFKFTINNNGILEIDGMYGQDNYLKQLIHLVKGHNFTLNDVTRIFEQSNLEYVLETSKNEEFQYVIYLKDNSIDPYRYCFTFDEMGGYYHRLLPYDYDKL